MLELKNILKIYNGGAANEHILLKNFDLTINHGEFVSVIGPNGSGKTSLLNIICGAIAIEGGDILLDNASIKKYPLTSAAAELAGRTRIRPWVPAAS